MLSRRLRTVVTTLIAVVVGAVVLPGCLITEVTQTQTITAPDPNATAFGSAFSMDERRAVVRAVVDGRPVVYVFDAVGPGWEHQATLVAPDDASENWGASVAVSGDDLAIADPSAEINETLESYGSVEIFRWADGAWTQTERRVAAGRYTNYGAGVWMSGTGLLTWTRPACDLYCTTGSWSYSQRGPDGYQHVRQATTGHHLAVGVDGGRFAFGATVDTSWLDPAEDAHLGVFHDTNPTWDLVGESVPYWIGEVEEDPSGVFRNVDIGGRVMAYENCCGWGRGLHIRRLSNAAYQPEASFPLIKRSDGLLVLGDLILLADRTGPIFHSLSYVNGRWKGSNDLELPAGTSFSVRPVAAGNRVMVGGANAVHILTVDLVDDAVEAA